MLETMHNSSKSIFFTRSKASLLSLMVKEASKLDPIILAALFSSILKLQISLIFISLSHFLFNSGLLNFFGN